MFLVFVYKLFGGLGNQETKNYKFYQIVFVRSINAIILLVHAETLKANMLLICNVALILCVRSLIYFCSNRVIDQGNKQRKFVFCFLNPTCILCLKLQSNVGLNIRRFDLKQNIIIKFQRWKKHSLCETNFAELYLKNS